MLTEQEINDLTNFREARRLLKENGIDTKGCDDLTNAKARLRKHFLCQRKSEDETEHKQVVQRIMKSNVAKRRHLLVQLRTLNELVEKAPKRVVELLHTVIKDYPDMVKQTEARLTGEGSAILLAGETSAGKSTLLNLLLGETERNLLPVAHQSCSSVITELRYGEKSHAIAHYWPELKKRPQVIDLSAGDAGEVLSQVIYQKGNRREKFPFCKVQVYLPAEWLKGGLVLVDSPGVGENQELTNMVKKYMHVATGFIYVIKASNAGGIQPERLEDLLHAHLLDIDKRKESGRPFDPRSVIFVCNHWDRVKPSQRDEVKKHIHRELRRSWPGYNPQQIFFLSAKEARDAVTQGYATDDYKRLLHGIRRLLPIGLNQQIERHYRFVESVPKELLTVIKTLAKQGEMGTGAHKVMCAVARVRLQVIANRPEQIIAETTNMLGRKIADAIELIKEHFQDHEVIRRVCRWSDHECPVSEDWDELQNLIIQCAANRIRAEVNQWEMENEIFKNIQKSVHEVFQKLFLSVKHELENIENRLAEGDLDKSETESQSSATAQSINSSGLGEPLEIPVGLLFSIFAFPMLVGAALADVDNFSLAWYMQNKAETLERATKNILIYMLEENNMQQLLEEKIRNILLYGTELFLKIPSLIEADLRLLKKMEESTEGPSMEQLGEMYKKVSKMQSSLALFYLRHLKIYDVELSDLKGWSEGNRPLAEGQFGKVYKARLARPGKPEEDVALKVYKDSIGEENAADFVLEEEILRSVQRECIIGYRGTAVKRTGDEIRPIMIMEFCSCSLSDVLYDEKKYFAPGKAAPSEQKRRATQATATALQIATGLMNIHEMGYVHRDLKPANILVKEGKYVRLADLGMTKQESSITGTQAGTPLYMAPEVLSRGGKYDRRADMFGFGMIMWELWYGECVHSVYSITNYEEFNRNAYCRQPAPPAAWKSVMSACWSRDPSKRPPAKKCRDDLKTYMSTLL